MNWHAKWCIMEKRDGNFWESRNFLEKILILIIVFLLLFVLSLFIVITLKYGSLFKQDVGDVPCLTPPCIKAAGQILEFIDPSVNPCDNFYDFVCGNFLKKTLETIEITPISKYAITTSNRLNTLITEPTNEPFRPLQLERQFYQSCMNTTAIEEDNSKTLMDLFEELGAWPVLKGRYWNGQHFHWLNSMIKSRRLGCNFYYFLNVAGVPNNFTKTFILSITPPLIYTPFGAFREAYIDLMTNIAIDLGAPTDNSVRNEFERVYELQKQIEQFVEDEKRYGQEVILPIGKLTLEFPSIPWVEFLNNLTITSIPFNEKTLVQFSAFRYLKNLLQLLNNTQSKTQANYIIWKTVEGLLPFLKKSVGEKYDSITAIVKPGHTVVHNRKILCLYYTKLNFPQVAEVAYVKKEMSTEKRNDVKYIIEKIKQQFKATIKVTEWMEDKDKKSSEKLLDDIQSYVGASDKVFEEDFDKIVNLEGFDFPSDNIIEMVRAISARTKDNYFRVINRNISELLKQQAEMSPSLQISAFYTNNNKALLLPAPFLQGLIYDFGRPQYMNYGGVGTAIGHELTHGITSLIFDKEFHWSNKTLENLGNKVECLLEEYDNYPYHLEQYTKNGTIALLENLADFISTNLAYKAYQNWVKTSGIEKKLPALDYTPNQIFWMVFASYRCYQPEFAYNYIRNDDHGVPSFIVNAGLRNSPYFGSDYNCPVDSYMNPKEKCQIM